MQKQRYSEEHVYYFPVRALSHMLNEAGFEVVKVRHVGKFVTLRLILGRLRMSSPPLARVFMSPFDIVAMTAGRK